jgi:hypothetical protein
MAAGGTDDRMVCWHATEAALRQRDLAYFAGLDQDQLINCVHQFNSMLGRFHSIELVQWLEQPQILRGCQLNYHKMLYCSLEWFDAAYVQWLKEARYAQLSKGHYGWHDASSGLMHKYSLDAIRYMLDEEGYKLPEQNEAGENVYQRAVMYDRSLPETMMVLEWLHQRGLRPNTTSCNWAIIYSPWPLETVSWLLNHGGTLSEVHCESAIRHLYHVHGSTAQECIALLEWMLAEGIPMDVNLCWKICEMSYLTELPAVLEWAIRHGAPWSEEAARDLLRSPSEQNLPLLQKALELGLAFPRDLPESVDHLDGAALNYLRQLRQIGVVTSPPE